MTTSIPANPHPMAIRPASRRPQVFAAALTAALGLACGGSSHSTPQQAAVNPPAPTPTATPISVLAGSPGGYGEVDGSAAAARFGGSTGICFDPQGHLLVAEASAIRQVDPVTGETSTWAGHLGYSGLMDGYLSDAHFGSNWAMVCASDGTLYLTDLWMNGIRKIDPKGLVTTLLPGWGTPYYNDGVGPNVAFALPFGLALDEQKGYLYVADDLNMAVRRVDLATTETTTLTGNPNREGTVDGPFESAQFRHPHPIVKALEDVLYVGCDDSVRKLDLATRQVTTLAGTPGVLGYADGVGSQVRFNGISGLALDGLGHLLITEGAYSAGYCGEILRSMDLATGEVTTLAGTGNDPGPDEWGGVLGLTGWADGIGGQVRFNMPWGIAVDGKGSAFISDQTNFVIRKMDLASGTVSTLAGTGPRVGAVDGPADKAAFNVPSAVALDAAGNAYVADQYNHLIRKITPQGRVTTLAGRAGVVGHADGPGASATFNWPADLAVDAKGNVYVADTSNHCIRKITANGTVSAFAGLPGPDNWGWVDGPGATARFYSPQGITLASDGNLYVCDTWNGRIRKITPDGTVSTFAGSGDFGLQDGVGVAAVFGAPEGLTDDHKGHLLVADTYNYAVRSIDLATAAVTTVAGGTQGSKDGVGAGAMFLTPYRIAVDPSGFMLVSDTQNHAIRKVTPSGTVTTVVGTLAYDQPSLPGVTLGNLPGQITWPTGLAMASDGTLLALSDCCVLKITGIK